MGGGIGLSTPAALPAGVSWVFSHCTFFNNSAQFADAVAGGNTNVTVSNTLFQNPNASNPYVSVSISSRARDEEDENERMMAGERNTREEEMNRSRDRSNRETHPWI